METDIKIDRHFTCRLAFDIETLHEQSDVNLGQIDCTEPI